MVDHFDWNPQKARTNRTKHGVSFEEAATTFADPRLTEPIEDESSPDERRWIVFGESSRGGVLRVVYPERGTKLRLISARKATPRQRQVYEEN
jgi:uncharacterized DUF497 family protein